MFLDDVDVGFNVFAFRFLDGCVGDFCGCSTNGIVAGIILSLADVGGKHNTHLSMGYGLFVVANMGAQAQLQNSAMLQVPYR